MQLKNRNKALIGGVATMAIAGGLLTITIQPAAADPVRAYAAVGSDTTQDVWNGLTNDFGAPIPSIASYDAFGGDKIKSKTAGVFYNRPAGSGNGVRALSAVWDPGFSGTWPTSGTGAIALDNEEVDFARSSSGPAAGAGLKYLPMGRDALTVAYNTAPGLSAGLNLTTGQIAELYSGVDNGADAVVTFSAQPATLTTVVSVNGVPVQPKIPQSGSGTRQFFQGAIGVATGSLAAYIVDGGLTGPPENDGNVIPADGDLVPFSVAQWISQKNGKAVNTTAGLELSSVNGAAPTTGSAPTMAPGALYGSKLGANYNTVPGTGVGAFNRDVYNVVPTAFQTGTLKQTTLANTILGTGGLNSGSARTVISSYGFGTLSYLGVSANFRDGAYQH